MDLDTSLWLEQWLQRYAGTLLIISHDRDFLDNVIGRTISFEAGKLINYQGNYSAFERQRAERLAQQQIAFDKQQQRKAEIEDFVRRFRAKATKAKQAQSRLKELNRMEELAPAHVDSPFSFRIDSSDKMSNPLLNLTHAQIGYGDKTVLRDVSLCVLPSTRIGLLGPNGAGKSSLVKTLAAALPTLGGGRVGGEHLQVGYFAQHQLEALDLQASAALHLQRLSPKATEQQIRTFLGSFGFQGDRAFETIEHFSGGEKARLALAIIAWQKPNLLLLDEPTNHLDLEMCHALTVALQAFEGAVIVVSHDRHLLRNTVDELVLVADGKVDSFDGDLDDYQRWLLQRRQQESASLKLQAASQIDSEDGQQPVDRKAQRQQAAEKRKQLQPLTNKIKKLERQVEKLQGQSDEIEAQLADSEIYDSENKAQLTDLLQRQADISRQLEEAEEAWMSASEELEALQD